MLLAEELDADWSKIKIEFSRRRQAYTTDVCMQAPAAAPVCAPPTPRSAQGGGGGPRAMLVAAAAETWGWTRSACHAEAGAVIPHAQQAGLTYGKLVRRRDRLHAARRAAQDPKIGRSSAPASGGSTRRPGGRQRPVRDRREVPGCSSPWSRAARVRRKVKTFDATKAKAVPGVRHECRSRAACGPCGRVLVGKEGRDALDVSWDEGPNAQVSSASISQLFAQRANGGRPWRATTGHQAALQLATYRVDAVVRAAVPRARHHGSR